MARRTGTVVDTRCMTHGEFDVLVEEEGRRRWYRVNGWYHDLDLANFAVGLVLSFKRHHSDDNDRSAPKWVMHAVRHPRPAIGRVAAAWLAWRHGGSIPEEVAVGIANRLRADGFQQDEDEDEGLRFEGGRVDAMVDIGPVFLQQGSVTVDAIPHSAHRRLVGMRLSDVVQLPFPTEEVISRVEGEDGWTQIHYDEPTVPLLARAA